MEIVKYFITKAYFLSKQLRLWFSYSLIAIASCICIGFCLAVQWEHPFKDKE